VTATFALVAALLAAAPKSDFDRFVSAFPAMDRSWPIDRGGPLDLELGRKLLVAPRRDASAPELPPLSPGSEATREFFHVVAAGRSSGPGYVALVVRAGEDRYAGTMSTFLVTFRPTGELVDSREMGSEFISDAGTVRQGYSFEPGRGVSLTTVTSVPVDGVPDIPAIATLSETLFGVAPTGLIVSSPARRASLSGRYVDHSSGETLYLLEKGRSGRRELVVGHRAKPGAKAQRLTVAQADARRVVVRFAGSPKDHVLTASDDFKKIVCSKPNGSLQTFELELIAEGN